VDDPGRIQDAHAALAALAHDGPPEVLGADELSPREAVSDWLVMARRGLIETKRKPALLVLLRSLPIARSAVLVGRTLSDLVRNVGSVILMLDAVRALTVGGDATRPVLGTLAWLAGLLLVFVPFAVSRYRALE
jgi:hypothetical protein